MHSHIQVILLSSVELLKAVQVLRKALRYILQHLNWYSTSPGSITAPAKQNRILAMLSIYWYFHTTLLNDRRQIKIWGEKKPTIYKSFLYNRSCQSVGSVFR